MTKPKHKLYTMKVEESMLKKWHQFAKSRREPLSDIIKKLMTDGKLPRVKNTKKVDTTLMRELNAIGNNINQIARAINSNKDINIETNVLLVMIEQQLKDLLDAHKISK